MAEGEEFLRSTFGEDWEAVYPGWVASRIEEFTRLFDAIETRLSGLAV